jgi:hypothetical protein
MNRTVDLTGLPEPVVRVVQQLVEALREQHTGESVSLTASESQQRPLPERFTSLLNSRPSPSAEELEVLLDELSSEPTGKVLPPDFSRADIYDDHD